MHGEIRRHGPHPVDQPPPLPGGDMDAPDRIPGGEDAADEEIIELSEEDIVPIEDEGEMLLAGDDLVELMEGGEAKTPERELTPEEREAKKRERRDLLKALTSKDLEPEAMLEMLAVYDRKGIDDPRTIEDLALVAEEYGLDVKEVEPAELRKLAILYNGIRRSGRDGAKENMGDVLERAMHERLVDQAFTRIDALQEALTASPDTRVLRERLFGTMRSLDAVAGQIKAAQGGLDAPFMDVVRRFNKVVAVKNLVRGEGVPEEIREEVHRIFDDAFEEYRDLIEDDIVGMRVKQVRESGSSTSFEHMMREVYGRDIKEVEKVKQKNRERVVAEILEMAKGGTVNAEMLERLHAVNNDSLMPKEMSKFREDEGMNVVFGQAKRLGVLAPDVRPVVEEIVERANGLIDRNALGKVSKLRYQIEAAALHNDLLDVHPFIDRNGSTSLLFLELMMTMRGDYEPDKKRERNFYKQVTRTVGYNPAAVATIGYEMAKMKYKPGFYGGPMPEERKKEHEKVSAFITRLRKQGRLR